jgi:hypothetical protein
MTSTYVGGAVNNKKNILPRSRHDPCGRMVCGRFLDGNEWFESRRERRYLSLVSVVCCQVEVSATGRSPVQRTPTECGVSSVRSRNLNDEET